MRYDSESFLTFLPVALIAAGLLARRMEEAIRAGGELLRPRRMEGPRHRRMVTGTAGVLVATHAVGLEGQAGADCAGTARVD